MPLMQGVLSGRWKTIEEIPPKRRRSRHYAGTREGARHGEAGCEELLMDTLASLRTCADDLGVPMAEMSLAWLVAQPDVTSVVIGARNPAQLRDNARAGDLRIDASMLARLNAITEPIKQRLGANADLWLGAAESRIR
jgi:aryl-alcohol dehydrogenase-like predicted oxidoreductase